MAGTVERPSNPSGSQAAALADRLVAADQAAKCYSAAQRGGDAVQPCPLEQRFAVEAYVVGDDDQPLGGIAVALWKDASSVLRGKTGEDGLVRFDGLEAGSYRLGLCELDKDAWELVGDAAMPVAASAGDAQWTLPGPAQLPAESTHTVVQGECAAKLADRYGFFVDTLWQWPANAALTKERASQYVLYPGDRLTIPAKRFHQLVCETGRRYTLHRLGVPERLDIQFLIGGEPRANAAYYLTLRTVDGRRLADESGYTGDDGRVKAWVPPDICEAEIRIADNAGTDDYVFAIGTLDPASTDSGASARLASLGFLTGLEGVDDALALAEAARRFQQSMALAPTGRLDARTIVKLEETFSGGS